MIQGDGYWILFVEQASSVDAVQYSCISALRFFMADENPSLRPLKGKLMEFAFMRSCFDILESETSDFFYWCLVRSSKWKWKTHCVRKKALFWFSRLFLTGTSVEKAQNTWVEA